MTAQLTDLDLTCPAAQRSPVSDWTQIRSPGNACALASPLKDDAGAFRDPQVLPGMAGMATLSREDAGTFRSPHEGAGSAGSKSQKSTGKSYKTLRKLYKDMVKRLTVDQESQVRNKICNRSLRKEECERYFRKDFKPTKYHYDFKHAESSEECPKGLRDGVEMYMNQLTYPDICIFSKAARVAHKAQRSFPRKCAGLLTLLKEHNVPMGKPKSPGFWLDASERISLLLADYLVSCDLIHLSNAAGIAVMWVPKDPESDPSSELGVQSMDINSQTAVTHIEVPDVPVENVSIVAPMSNVSMSVSEVPWDLSTYLKRQEVVAYFDWSTSSSGLITDFDILEELILHTRFLKLPFYQFGLLWFELDVEVKVAATQFQSGALIIYHEPSNAGWVAPNPNILAFNHQMINISETMGAKLHIPYTAITPVIPTTALHADVANLGRFKIRVWNGLQVATGSNTTIEGSVHISMKNVKLNLPQEIGDLTYTTLPDYKYPEGGMASIFAAPLAEAATGMVGKGIGYLTEQITQSVGNLDKPTFPIQSAPVRVEGVGYLAHGVGPEYIQRLALHCGSTTMSMLGDFSGAPEDMDLASLSQIPCRLLTLRVTGASKGEIKSFVVHPGMFGDIVRDGESHMAYLSQCCTKYRGSIKFIFEVVGPRMCSCRLFIYYDPNGNHPDVQNAINALTWDIQTETRVEIECPYIATTPWRTTECATRLIDSATPNRMNNGVVRIFVLQQFQAPVSCPQGFDINVIALAGPDFELAIPCPPPSLVYDKKAAESLTVPLGDHVPLSDITLATLSEDAMDFKTRMRRWMPLGFLDTNDLPPPVDPKEIVLHDRSIYTSLVIPLAPSWPCVSSFIELSQAGRFYRFAYTPTPVHFMSRMFSQYRGSWRIKIVATDGGRPVLIRVSHREDEYVQMPSLSRAYNGPPGKDDNVSVYDLNYLNYGAAAMCTATQSDLSVEIPFSSHYPTLYNAPYYNRYTSLGSLRVDISTVPSTALGDFRLDFFCAIGDDFQFCVRLPPSILSIPKTELNFMSKNKPLRWSGERYESRSTLKERKHPDDAPEPTTTTVSFHPTAPPIGPKVFRSSGFPHVYDVKEAEGLLEDLLPFKALHTQISSFVTKVDSQTDALNVRLTEVSSQASDSAAQLTAALSKFDGLATNTNSRVDRLADLMETVLVKYGGVADKGSKTIDHVQSEIDSAASAMASIFSGLATTVDIAKLTVLATSSASLISYLCTPGWSWIEFTTRLLPFAVSLGWNSDVISRFASWISSAGALQPILESTRTESAGELLMSTAFIGALSSCVVGVLTFSVFGKFPDTTDLTSFRKDILRTFTEMGIVGRGIMGFEKVFDVVSVVIEKGMYFVGTRLEGNYGLDDTMMTKLNRAAAVFSQYQGEMRLMLLSNDLEAQNTVFKAYDDLNEVRTAIINHPRPPSHLVTELESLWRDSKKVVDTALRSRSIPYAKEKPFHLALYGASNLGKTGLAYVIARVLADEMGWALFNLVYARGFTDFWDNFFNQKVVLRDDSDQKAHDERSLEMFTHDSNAVGIVPMADLGDKGRAFLSKAIISTNNKFSVPNNHIVEQSAYDRRRDFVIRMSDGTKDAVSRLALDDKWSGVLFTRVDAVTERTIPWANGSTAVDFETMCSFVRYAARQHYDNQAKVVETLLRTDVPPRLSPESLNMTPEAAARVLNRFYPVVSSTQAVEDYLVPQFTPPHYDFLPATPNITEETRSQLIEQLRVGAPDSEEESATIARFMAMYEEMDHDAFFSSEEDFIEVDKYVAAVKKNPAPARPMKEFVQITIDRLYDLTDDHFRLTDTALLRSVTTVFDPYTIEERAVLLRLCASKLLSNHSADGSEVTKWHQLQRHYKLGLLKLVKSSQLKEPRVFIRNYKPDASIQFITTRINKFSPGPVALISPPFSRTISRNGRESKQACYAVNAEPDMLGRWRLNFMWIGDDGTEISEGVSLESEHLALNKSLLSVFGLTPTDFEQYPGMTEFWSVFGNFGNQKIFPSVFTWRNYTSSLLTQMQDNPFKLVLVLGMSFVMFRTARWILHPVISKIFSVAGNATAPLTAAISKKWKSLPAFKFFSKWSARPEALAADKALSEGLSRNHRKFLSACDAKSIDDIARVNPEVAESANSILVKELGRDKMSILTAEAHGYGTAALKAAARTNFTARRTPAETNELVKLYAEASIEDLSGLTMTKEEFKQCKNIIFDQELNLAQKRRALKEIGFCGFDYPLDKQRALSTGIRNVQSVFSKEEEKQIMDIIFKDKTNFSQKKEALLNIGFQGWGSPLLEGPSIDPYPSSLMARICDGFDLPRVPMGMSEAESVTDTNSTEIVLHRVRPNTAFVSIFNDKRRSASNAFFVKGNILMGPRHLFGDWPEGATVIVWSSKNPDILSYHPDNCTYIEGKDLCFYRCAGITPRKDNVSLFIKDVDMPDLGTFDGLMNVKRYTANQDSVVTEVYDLLHSGVVRVPPRGATWESDNITYSCVEHYNHTFATQKGDCGGVMAHQVTRVPRKLCGMHVCSNPTTGGSCIPITQELIAQGLRKFKNIVSFAENCEVTILPPSLDLELIKEDDVFHPETQKLEKVSVHRVRYTVPSMFEGNFTFLGEIPKESEFHMPSKTQIAPSLIHNIAYETTSQPAILSDRDPRNPDRIHPLAYAISKYSKNVPIWPKREMDWISNELDKTILECPIWRPPRLLTIQEAIEGNLMTEPLKMSTSPGYPYVLEAKGRSGKGWLFHEGAIINEGLKLRMAKRLTLAARGQMAPSIHMDMPKDERRPHAKIAAIKTRQITCLPIDHQLLMRIYFGDYFAHLRYNRHRIGNKVGINIYSQEASSLLNWLEEVGEDGFDDDISDNDGAASGYQHHWRTAQGANLFYNDGPVNALIRFVLISEASTAIHLIKIACDKTPGKYITVAYIIQQGLNSGVLGTTEMNCRTNSNIDRMTFRRLATKFSEPLCLLVGAYDKMVRRAVFGDDGVTKRSKELSWFNLENKIDCARTLGITLTPGTKGRSSLFKCSSFSFLKNTFRRDPTNPEVVLAMLEHDSITDMTNWIKTTKTQSGDEMLAYDNIYDALRYVSNYPKDVAKNFAKKINAALDSVGRPRVLFNYDMYRADISGMNEQLLLSSGRPTPLRAY